MNKLIANTTLFLNALLFFSSPAAAQTVNCATTPDMPTCACTQLGATKMSNDHSNIVACMLTTPNTTATTCAAGGGCAWKATTGGAGGGIGQCYTASVNFDIIAYGIHQVYHTSTSGLSLTQLDGPPINLWTIITPRLVGVPMQSWNGNTVDGGTYSGILEASCNTGYTRLSCANGASMIANNGCSGTWLASADGQGNPQGGGGKITMNCCKSQ